jgi:hypothetical protein
MRSILEKLPYVVLSGWGLLMADVVAAEGQAPPSVPEQVLASDDFRGDLRQWKVDAQDPATLVKVLGGALDVYAPEGVTVWFKNKFSGNYEIRFTATPVEESFEKYPKRVSDLNVFWNASVGGSKDGDPSAQGFDGTLAAYNPLHLYYVGLGANGNKTTRLRKYDGSALRPQIAGYAEATDAGPDDRSGVPPDFARLAAGQAVQLRIVSRQATGADPQTLKFFANDHLVFGYADAVPYTEGWFAFRTAKSHFRISDFKVFRN